MYQYSENTYNLRSNKRQKINNDTGDNQKNDTDKSDKNNNVNNLFLDLKRSKNMNFVKNIISTYNIEKFCGPLKFHKHPKISDNFDKLNTTPYEKYIYNNNTTVECLDYLNYHNTNFINEKIKNIYDNLNNSITPNITSISKSKSIKAIKTQDAINIIFIWFLKFDNEMLNFVPVLISKYAIDKFNFNVKNIEEQHLISKNNYIIDSSWISASKTRNYLLDDPLIDYLEYNKLYDVDDLINFEENNVSRKRKLSFSDTILSEKQNNEQTFLNTLFSNGKQFEDIIINNLKEKFPTDFVCILDISNYTNLTFKQITDPIFFEITKKAINEGIPIIYQGVLHNIETKSFGLPDLLVRSDYINKIFNQHIDINDVILKKTNQLPYYVIDIKNSNIHLSANSDNVLNHIGTKPFKGQIAIYHQILSKLQEYDTEKGFILASKWTRKQKDNTYTCTNPFDRLGIINFSESDSSYLKIANDAIKWHQLVRTDNNNLKCIDPTHDNLYPNMKNMTDTKFKNIKKFLANKNYEITNIWKCGVKNRTNAFKKGIKKWSNPKLNSSILGINGKDGELIDKMLSLNRSENNNVLIIPNKIKSNINKWRDINKLAFYLDFETINPTTFEIKMWADTDINQTIANDLIFMIGIGHSINNEWSYKSFVVEDLSNEKQTEIIYKMFDYIKNISDLHGFEGNKYQDINIYHWSSFEQIILTKSCSKYNIPLPIYKWMDILKLFHEEPIIVKGALNFSLKTIGKAMYDNKLIDVYWDDSECKSGLDAMFQAYQIYSLKTNNSINGNNSGKIKSIVNDEQMKIINKYNEIDCKIMWAILNYLRINH